MVDRLPADLADTDELQAFASEVRQWLGDNLTDEFRQPTLVDPTAADGNEFEVRRRWQRILDSGGWAGVHWPREHGGRGVSLVEHAIFLQESARAGAPEPVNVIGLSMVGPTIIQHGGEQHLALLPAILAADDIWCQLFSEPDAGSDLANISTKVREVDGTWYATGQKVWTSWGMQADRGLLLARTGDAGRKGLSCFLIDMHAPGVTVRPLRQMSGGEHFCEVFLDNVPMGPDALLGAVGDGWRVAMSTLVSERSTAIFSRHAHVINAAEELLALALEPGVEPAELDRAVQLWSEAQLLRLTAYRGLAIQAENPDNGTPAALLIQRIQWGLTSRAIMTLGYRLASAQSGSGAAGRWRTLMLAARGWTIGGGTSEIQRNMIAETVLGLPRQERPAARAAGAAQ
jgi:alkylation response protein AidB-like acyl-CoA dehydrogenase